MITTKPEVEPTGRYSINETAIKLGISRRTVERYIKNEDIKAQVRKIDGKHYVTGIEILKVWNQSY